MTFVNGNDSTNGIVRSTFGTSAIPYLSFSGCDIKAVATVRPYRHEVQFNQSVTTMVLANIQTISVSTFREKMPIRGLGQIGPKGYTRGIRSIAGSIVFTMFNQEVLWDFLRLKSGDADSGDEAQQFRYVTIDQIPPFDVILMFANEYGFLSRQVIRGVDLAATGQVMSVQDLYIEKTAQYVALDISPLEPFMDQNKNGYQNPFNNVEASGINFPQTVESKLNSDDYLKKVFDKMRNPFK